MRQKDEEMMRTHRLAHRRALTAIAAAAAMTIAGAFALDTGSASAQTQLAQQQLSGNWSGYVVRSSAGKSFSSVSGSWVEPSVSDSSGQGYAAFWVGLGGAGAPQSQSLEQVGTAAQVVDGKTSYYAWYELVPASQQALSLAVHPGDHMSGKVSVAGSRVTIWLSDETTGASVTRTLRMSSPDTSSAEWIAEAPAAQYPDGSTQVLPLANFGKVSFTAASATAAGHTGSIGDPAWTVDQVELNAGASSEFVGGGAFGANGPGAAQQSAGASAGGLSNSGSAFTVSYSSNGGSTGSGAQGSGTGYGDPSGYGYPGGYGYGYPGAYGYPGYGYGDPGYGYSGGYGYGVYGLTVGS